METAERPARVRAGARLHPDLPVADRAHTAGGAAAAARRARARRLPGRGDGTARAGFAQAQLRRLADRRFGQRRVCVGQLLVKRRLQLLNVGVLGLCVGGRTFHRLLLAGANFGQLLVHRFTRRGQFPGGIFLRLLRRGKLLANGGHFGLAGDEAIGERTDQALDAAGVETRRFRTAGLTRSSTPKACISANMLDSLGFPWSESIR